MFRTLLLNLALLGIGLSLLGCAKTEPSTSRNDLPLKGSKSKGAGELSGEVPMDQRKKYAEPSPEAKKAEDAAAKDKKPEDAAAKDKKPEDPAAKDKKPEDPAAKGKKSDSK